jgi:hypothetical protein
VSHEVWRELDKLGGGEEVCALVALSNSYDWVKPDIISSFSMVANTSSSLKYWSNLQGVIRSELAFRATVNLGGQLESQGVIWRKVERGRRVSERATRQPTGKKQVVYIVSGVNAST